MCSLGTRNTLSFFNHDPATGKGIGGQFRLRLGEKLNSEWYFDYISSRNGSFTYRNDYHIGWSLLFYTGKDDPDAHVLQPYFIAGHCFDKSTVTAVGDKSNSAGRLSMATQAGLGTQIRIAPRLDASLSSQYMLHFGKEIEVRGQDGKPVIEKNDFTGVDGHLLFTLSFNYRLCRLWH